MSSNDSTKNPTRVAAGLNPPSPGTTSHAIGGYKATLTNDSTSDRAKAHAKEILEAAGYTVTDEHANTDEHHTVFWLATGCAPQYASSFLEDWLHAREYLKKHDV
ncbi:hypothetical protein B0H14DRAFT_3517480 [Mycena olivaceomarginata]|nr:hypothetical protein B0H14DRAFT_3517480 [Mycena olivaceomarginata]